MNDNRATAVAFLECLQRDHWKEKEATTDQKERVQKYVGELKAALGVEGKYDETFELEKITSKQKMFSKYESVETFMILSRIVDNIEVVVSQFDRLKNDKKILFGSLNTGDVNGVAINFENPEYFIVLIDDGVFGFANLLAKALAQSFPQKEDSDGYFQLSVDLGDVKKKLNEAPEIGHRLIDLVLGYVVGGNPHRAKPYIPPKELVGLISAWRDIIEYFILGHEFGHARLGHLDSQFRHLIHHDGFDEIPLNWQQEFEADFFGLVVALQCLAKTGIDPSLSYAGIEAFFCGLELIEVTLAQFNSVAHSDEGSSTHPPAKARLDALRIGLGEMLDKETAEASIHLALVLEQVINFTKPQLSAVVDDLKAQGVRPHRKWG